MKKTLTGALRLDHHAEGWNVDHTFRWIEVGRLRLSEDADGANATIEDAWEHSVWLSATELAALSRLLGSWFAEDPVEGIRRIETCAAFVQDELEKWNQRARIDEEHPPYDHLTRALASLLAECRELRKINDVFEPRKDER